MDVVYATASGHVGGPDGLMVMVRKGTHWPASDPVVQASPSAFSPDPRWGLCWSVPPPADDQPAAVPLVEAPVRRQRTAAAAAGGQDR